MEIIVDLRTDEDGVHGSITAPMLDGSRALTDVSNVRFESPRVHFEDGAGRVYEGALEGDTISGTAELSGRSAPFILERIAGVHES